MKTDLYTAEKRQREVEERVLAAFLAEMSHAPVSEPEWRLIAVHCAIRLLESAESSLRAEVLRAHLAR